MATAKVMIILLVITAMLTTSAVLITVMARPTDTLAALASLLRLATAVSWIVLAVVWVGERIIDKIAEARAEIAEARAEALGQIKALAERWGDKVLAAEFEHHLTRAEEGSSGSLDFLSRVQRKST